MLPEQQVLFRAVEPQVKALVEAHTLERQALWMPSDLLFPDMDSQDERIAELRDAAAMVPLHLRAIFALNLLTEEGLPSYFYLLKDYLADSVFSEWIGRWTAEEDRHGQVLGQLARFSNLFPRVAIFEGEQFKYLQRGFTPEWQQDPYQLLAYTAVQEEATRISHGNLAAKCKQASAGVFAPILGNVAAEEGFHARFYAEIVKLIFEHDPSTMLVALWKSVGTFSMPGKSMSQYKDLSRIAIRAHIFTPVDFANILERLYKSWQLTGRRPDTVEASTAKRRLLELPPKLRVLGKRIASEEARTYSLPFLGETPFTI